MAAEPFTQPLPGALGREGLLSLEGPAAAQMQRLPETTAVTQGDTRVRNMSGQILVVLGFYFSRIIDSSLACLSVKMCVYLLDKQRRELATPLWLSPSKCFNDLILIL